VSRTKPILFSQHALDQLDERKIDQEWAVRTLHEPEFVREDPRKGGVWRAFRQIPEAGGRWLRVVYLEKDEGQRIITVFLDRGAERWR
jgi:hypothetical protein